MGRDFSDVSEGFAPLPAGFYPAVVQTATPGVTKGGEEKWSIAWQIRSGEYEGRLIFQTWMMEGKGRGFTKEALIALDHEPEDWGDFDIEPEEMIGAEATLQLDIDNSYVVNGKAQPQNVVKHVKSASAEFDEVPF